MLRRNFLILATGLLAGSLALATPSYYPAALGDFDGAADYLSRGAELTGAADGKVGLFSGWVRFDGGDGVAQRLLCTEDGFFYVNKKVDNALDILAYASGPSVRHLDITTSSTFTASASWVHFLISWNLAIPIAHLYVDDVSDKIENILTDGVIDYTRSDWHVGAHDAPNYYLNGALAELYFSLEYLDISVTANRRKFISAAGHPVPLGADGSLPTGTAPIIYMRERWNNCGINSGTGGDFVIHGAPAFTEGPAGRFFPFTTEIPARGRGSRMRPQELFQ